MSTAARALGGGGWARASSLGLSLLVAVLPKCTVCVMAHATVLGYLGITGIPRALPRPVAAAALVLALSLLAYRAPARRGYGPLVAGCAAALLVGAELAHQHTPAVHAGHAAPHSQIATIAGGLLLVAASVWNAWPVRRRSCPSHC